MDGSQVSEVEVHGQPLEPFHPLSPFRVAVGESLQRCSVSFNITPRPLPQPITIAGLVGANRLLYYYPDSPRPQDWSEQAVANRPRGIPCYGVIDGFWVNYSPGCAVSFTNQGEPENVFDQAVRPGVPSAAFGSRPINWAEVTRRRRESL